MLKHALLRSFAMDEKSGGKRPITMLSKAARTTKTNMV